MDNSYPFDCLLFTDCSLSTGRCNFCYTGENDCYSEHTPHATLLIGGEASQVQWGSELQSSWLMLKEPPLIPRTYIYQYYNIDLTEGS